MFDWMEQYNQGKENSCTLKNQTYEITYGELADFIAYRQEELKEIYKSGDKVILQVKSQMAFAIDFLCYVSIGCWVLPVPGDMKKEELTDLHNITGGDIQVSNENTIKQCIAVWGGNRKEVRWDKHNGGILHMTSGTTGKTKLCIRDFESLLAEGNSYIQCFGIHQQDRILSVCPITHSFAFGGAFLPALISGVDIYVVEQFVPRKVLKTISEEKMTIVLMVPAIADAMAAVDRNNKYDISSLRIGLVGAGKTYSHLFNSYKEKYNIILSGNYGSTETGGLASRVSGENYESVGKTMPGVEIQIRSKNGMILKCGQEGEIYVKSPAMFSGYFGESESTFDENGYFKMGDIGKIDEEGYVYILGRSKHLIKIGGKTVNPREIESVIMKHTKITDCVIVGKTDEKSIEYMKAYIVAEDISKEEVRLYLSQHLSSRQIPRVIELVRSIKKNAIGKVDYSVL
ncbi:MAG: fatty acid--CoA ligase family protein [Lachnospiraceae bacterium]|nr:fatty acid--CoA ligase family protein [Lachnospiraceae bacterium]